MWMFSFDFWSHVDWCSIILSLQVSLDHLDSLNIQTLSLVKSLDKPLFPIHCDDPNWHQCSHWNDASSATTFPTKLTMHRHQILSIISVCWMNTKSVMSTDSDFNNIFPNISANNIKCSTSDCYSKWIHRNLISFILFACFPFMSLCCFFFQFFSSGVFLRTSVCFSLFHLTILEW